MLKMQKKLSVFFYFILSLPSTAMGFALVIQISTLSWLLRTKYNLDLNEIGFVWAAGPIAGIITQPVVGLISDNVWFWNGRRKPFIIIGGTLASMMLLTLPNIDKISSFFGSTNILLTAVIIVLTLYVAINFSLNPTRSIIADVTPEGASRTKGFTWMQTISGSFSVLAYTIGAIWGNYFLIYFGVFLVMSFSIIPMAFISESRVLEPLSKNLQIKSVKTDWGQYLKLLFAHSISWIGVQTMFVYMIGYIEQKLNPANKVDIGKILLISFLILNIVRALLPAFVLVPLTKKIGRVKTHILSISIMSLGYLGIVLLGKTTILVWILMAVCGVGWASIVSLPLAILSEKVDKNKMGFFMGIFNLSVALPQLFASLVLGSFIQDAKDKNLIFIISFVSLGISAALWFMVNESKSFSNTTTFEEVQQ